MPAHAAVGGQHAIAATPLLHLIDTRFFRRSFFTLFLLIAFSFSLSGEFGNCKGLCLFTSLPFQGRAALFIALLLVADMEGKKLSFVDELFPKKETTSSSKSDILSSIFPPRSSGAAKECSHYEASGVMTGRKLGIDGHSLNVQSGTSGGSPLGSPSKRIISKKNNSPVLLCEIAEPCLMSSSVHYGGRDDFIPDSSSSRNSGTSYNFKKDKEDDFNNSDVATRGEWWQGSYYY